MIIKFNPTGTHVRNGLLKVRLDVYPELGDKTYTMHYIDRPVRDYTGAELETDGQMPFPQFTQEALRLQALVPQIKVLNPCLCHFVTIDKDMTLNQLGGFVRSIFDKSTLTQLDNLLSNDITDGDKLSQIMNSKFGSGNILPLNTKVTKLVDMVNSRFVGLGVRI